MEKGDIRFHKKFNNMPIAFGKEVFINVFYGVIKKFNQMREPGILEMNKKEFWELMGFDYKNYQSKYLREVLDSLTQNTHFKVDEEKEISGSIFTTKLDSEIIKIAVTEFYKPYIFTKTDIEIMTKAKRKEKMKLHELDYWDSTLKYKKSELVLLREADILGISGKYSKRLYTLLGQFKKSGQYYCNIEKFKKILEIPSSYRMYDIDRSVLNPAIKELKDKTEIYITEIRKIKKGRVISKLEFYFKYGNSKVEEKSNNQIISKAEQIEVQASFISDDVLRLIEQIRPKVKENYELRGIFNGLQKTKEQLEEFIKQNDIEI